MTAQKPAEPCCPAWKRACEEGCDNEGFNSVISMGDEGFPVVGGSEYNDRGESRQILPPLNFCPWCGVAK